MATTLSPTLRKAALLIRSLDADSSAVLLGQLFDDEAQAVRRAIRDLGEVDPLEQEELRSISTIAPTGAGKSATDAIGPVVSSTLPTRRVGSTRSSVSM